MRSILFAFCLTLPQLTGASFSGEWINYTCENQIAAITHFGDSIWLGAYQGGLIFLDAKTDDYTIYNKANSRLADNNVSTLAVDSTGALYIGSRMFQIMKEDAWIKDTFVSVGPYMKITCKDGNIYAGWYVSTCLWKYDGTKWDSVQVGSPASSSFIIHDILPINKDSIWVSSYDGLYLVRNFSSVDEILTEPVNAILRDSSGAILCGTTFYGVKKLNGTTWTSYDTLNSGLPANFIQCMKIDSKNRLWLGTNAGLVKFDGSTWSVYNSANSDLPGNSIGCLDIDDKDRVWIGIGSNKGFSRFDGTSCKTYSFGSMPSNSCFSVAFDKNNTTWMSYYDGLASFNGVRWDAYTFSSAQIPPLPLREIYADTGLKIWADSQVAVSLNHAPSYFSRANGLCKTGSSGGIVRDKNGILWTSIHGRLCTFDGTQWQQVDSRSFPVPAAFVTMACGFDGKIYIAGEDNDSSVLVSFDSRNWKTAYLNNKKFSNSDLYVSALAVDSANNVWAGVSLHSMAGTVSGSGIHRYNGTKWDTFNVYNSGNTSNTIWALEFDGHGNLWAGGSAGLVKYDGKTWTAYTMLNSGLPHDFVNAIAVDANDNKWIATNFGGLAVFREGGVVLPAAASKPSLPKHANGLVHNAGIRGNVFRFSVRRSCLMAVALYDLIGRCIGKAPRQRYDTGTHRLTLFKTYTLHNGVSVVTFSGPDMEKQSMLVR